MRSRAEQLADGGGGGGGGDGAGPRDDALGGLVNDLGEQKIIDHWNIAYAARPGLRWHNKGGNEPSQKQHLPPVLPGLESLYIPPLINSRSSTCSAIIRYFTRHYSSQRERILHRVLCILRPYRRTGWPGPAAHNHYSARASPPQKTSARPFSVRSLRGCIRYYQETAPGNYIYLAWFLRSAEWWRVWNSVGVVK